MKIKVNEIETLSNITTIHKWQNSKCGIFRWKCKCCHPHADEQKAMQRRTRRVTKHLLNELKNNGTDDE